MREVFSRSTGGSIFMAAGMAALFLSPLHTQGGTSATVAIQANQPGTVISPDLFGIFFEEINFGGDGGIYAEMVRNRSFQESASPVYWTLVQTGSANGSISVDYAEPLNTNIVSSLKLTRNPGGSGSAGAGNSGYWGMSVESGASYDLSLFAKDNGGYAGTISARLESADGSTLYDSATLGSPTAGWQKLTATLTSGGTDSNARLVVSIDQSGSVWLSMVSLFPQDTYMGRGNGLRSDLANMLAVMEPAFLRFPGGNFIESYDVSTAVRWKKSIGPIEQRPGHDNNSWGYWSTDGLGAHEFFLWCEDMGMEPMYDINAGLMLGYDGSPNNTVPLEEMGPWVQDALDIIEYANGDTNTPWGAVRAANGHPEPFNMKYLEIGNENGGTLLDERYTLFYDAIKPVYPDIHLIAAGGNWGGGPPWSRPVEIMDEHYYNSPSEMIAFANKYDHYSRNGSKVFVGEYATKIWGDSSRDGSLEFALAEAVFMTGMERNSDIVVLAAYAPMFGYAGHTQWDPDLIYYDNNSCYGTPSYYVQKMFARNTSGYVLPTTVSLTGGATNPAPHGAIGLGAWNTAVEYDDVVVISNSTTIYSNDFSSGAGDWNVYKGTWGVSGGAYQQTDITTDCRSTTGDTGWANYTISLRAQKLGGSEGFLILFNWQDDNNYTWLNLGGWNNTQHAVEYSVNGSKTILGSAVPGSISPGWHDIEIVINGYNVKCYLDSGLVLDVDYPASAASGLYATTSYDTSSDEVVIKAVNPYDTAVDATFDLSGVAAVASTGTVIQLTSGSAFDRNSLAVPTNVSPVTNTISTVDTNFMLTLPANSFSILRLVPVGIDNYSALMLDVPSPIDTGEQVGTTLWGYQSGGWVNLSSNTTFAITYSSQNPNIAAVDTSGNVTGISSGTTGIIATYGALDLSVTQSVQVVSVPVTLVHRYSFDETSGSTVHDSIGGSAWNGTLPNGGSFGDGQAAFDSGSEQFVELPAYVLGGADAVTIEAWATFPANLPTYCFFFGFGDISGALGYDYIFCQPLTGRIAITDDSFGNEQNAYGYTDFSFRTNLHITAVFNPPGGYLALYTNGVLAGINHAITIPMSAVNDAYSFIGRSLFSSDSFFDFSLDEFRIYDGALSPAEIAATQALGPDALLSTNAPVIQVSSATNNLVVGWPAASAGFTVQSRTNLLDGNWADDPSASPQLIDDRWQAMLPTTQSNTFIRLRK